jgi:hypothetical protein
MMADWDDPELSFARAEGGDGPQRAGSTEPVAARAGVNDARYMKAIATHLRVVRMSAMIPAPSLRCATDLRVAVGECALAWVIGLTRRTVET